ncbi:MAG: hypothetical protein EU529_04035 [Promethearchaeota archaeon]|nr:MAG: hypothetical protein EU529_04035 [Candidatus Lokiarchaeota archaeon]
MNETVTYSKTQKIIATILYISMVIISIITIGGFVYTIADLIMAEGKLELFQEQNLGIQIAIIGALFAGLFILIVLGIGLSTKGRLFFLRTIFRERKLHSKYKNNRIVQSITISLLVSILAIIIGIVVAFFYELFIEVSFTFLQDFSDGQILLFVALLILMVFGLIVGFFYFWFNGYALIIKLIYTLEEEEEDTFKTI